MKFYIYNIINNIVSKVKLRKLLFLMINLHINSYNKIKIFKLIL